MLKKRALIVGAGACGMQFAQTLAAVGLDTVLVDRFANPGGIWQPAREHESTPGVTFSTLRSNLPMQGMCLRPTQHAPSIQQLQSFPSSQQLSSYLFEFSRNLQDVPFWMGATVSSIVRNCQSNATSAARRWTATVSSPSSAVPEAVDAIAVGPDTWSLGADFVAFCGGHYSQEDAEWPEIPGLSELRSSVAGAVIHSCSYDGPGQLKGRRVLVIGGGSSGTDIARDAAAVGRCYWAKKRSWSGPSGLADLGKPQEVAPVAAVRPRAAAASQTQSPGSPAGPTAGSESLETDSAVVAELANGVSIEVDVVVVCTGYALAAPPIFIPTDPGSGLPGAATASKTDSRHHIRSHKASDGVTQGYRQAIGSTASPASAFAKCLEPLVLHLLYRDDPTVCVAGLPLNVMPWPLFRDQADFVASYWSSMDNKMVWSPTAADLQWMRDEVDLAAARSLIGLKTSAKPDEKDPLLLKKPWHFLGPAQFHYRMLLQRLSAAMSNPTQTALPSPASESVAGQSAGADPNKLWIENGTRYLQACRGAAESVSSGAEASDTRFVAASGGAGGHTLGAAASSTPTPSLPRSIFGRPTLGGVAAHVKRLKLAIDSEGKASDTATLPVVADASVLDSAVTVKHAVPPEIPADLMILSRSHSPGQDVGPHPGDCYLYAPGCDQALGDESKPSSASTDDVALSGTRVGLCVRDTPPDHNRSAIRRIEMDRLVYNLCGAARNAGEAYRAAQFMHVVGANPLDRASGGTIAGESGACAAKEVTSKAAATEGIKQVEGRRDHVECAALGVFPGSSSAPPELVIVAPVAVIDAIERVMTSW